MSRRPLKVGAIAAALAVAGAVLSPVAATQAEAAVTTYPYYALGDSYSSGNGAGAYASDGTSCNRSAYGWPNLLTQLLDSPVKLQMAAFKACQGAWMRHIVTEAQTVMKMKAPQYDSSMRTAIGSKQAILTLSIGGNDAGLLDYMLCAVSSTFQTSLSVDTLCRSKLKYFDMSKGKFKSDFENALRDTYVSVLTQNPNTKVLVVGYPAMAPSTNPSLQMCGGLAISRGDMYYLTTQLNQAIKNAVTAAAASYSGRLFFVDVNAGGLFTGHDLCAGANSYFNSVNKALSLEAEAAEVGHPNVQGQGVYAKAVINWMKSNSSRMTANISSNWPFWDVPPTSSQSTAITWLKQQGVTTGYSDGSYAPNDGIKTVDLNTFFSRLGVSGWSVRGPITGTSVNRGGFAEGLYVWAGSPANSYGSPFEDVTSGSYYWSTRWMRGKGLATGYCTGSRCNYQPYSALTRGDAAVFLYRAFGHFSDVVPSTAHSADIAWMYLRGITTGWDMGGGRYEYRPYTAIVRNDLNTFMQRIRSRSSAYLSGTSNITRKDFANLLYSASTGGYASDATQWMISNKLTDATTYSGYNPSGWLYRNDTAAFLHRAFDKGLFK
ncbi:MAG: S-layer homology domain-containing protein [Propionibacteriaceae bacterium]|jgi:hypothetical protein|nr:S-layer homology domain-containing protein [Propionibacteriaceae bacterium]